mmetsp:Transcript_243/g.531  ORF Transcript_243/g.531 Transcript_243/m.531 type:complete len:320 (+) Transcript_243:132-1091(+)
MSPIKQCFGCALPNVKYGKEDDRDFRGEGLQTWVQIAHEASRHSSGENFYQIRRRLSDVESPRVRTNLTPRDKNTPKPGGDSSAIRVSPLASPLAFDMTAEDLYVNSNSLSGAHNCGGVLGGQLVNSYQSPPKEQTVPAWSTHRLELQSNIEQELTRQATPEMEWAPYKYVTTSSARLRLSKRIARLGLSMKACKGDGNCQFRAISQQLYGNQNSHKTIREKCVKYLAENRAEYEDFIGASTFQDYLNNMRKSQVWGDELTLCSAANVLDCMINVVTSEKQNWYMQYWPGRGKSVCQKEIFLAYTFPLHYDSLQTPHKL